jgi:hypothetical protein
MDAIKFSSDTNEKKLLGESTYTFDQPRVVEANLPELEIFISGKKIRCQMDLK